MSHWFYVTIGWLLTYGVIGVWIYTSRTPKKGDTSDTDV